MTTKKRTAKKLSGGRRTPAPAAPRVPAAAIDEAVNTAAPSPARTHELKSWPSHFAPAVAGLKPFDIRYDDRGFVVGDRLRLREWIPLGSQDDGYYTGREHLVAVTFIATASCIRDGCVAMTVAPVDA